MALYLARHGATEWSEAGRHTSTTDLPLLPAGEESAKRLAPRLAGRRFERVLTSPRQRARRTAELAGFPDAVVDEDLVEWAYGSYEGITTAEIHEHDPGWSIWTGETPGGETPEQVAERLDRVIARVRALEGDTLAFAHGHCLRALAARWLGEPVAFGRFLVLGTATLSVLGDDRGQPAVVTWNS
ncbi:histidine phosphatase family protein [Nocardioides sp. BP30]|uniref:histidine phosphatase family protein n=1 Tax=Nocardioides sp. BP30 TaxID=3036374 RepID=UPI002468B9EE|nr:histidine phosphatase family protein [Nocardioides sp. BP30]WGL51472.1 histidine phosphatase family protein [Nocardioides sp. BP30]